MLNDDLAFAKPRVVIDLPTQCRLSSFVRTLSTPFGETLKGNVVYNGPKEPVIELLPTAWVGQKTVSMVQMRRAKSPVSGGLRLQSVL